MEQKELMQFLINKGLFSTVKDNAYFFKRIFRQCLDAKQEDKIIMITDLGEEDKNVAAMVAGAYYYAAKSLDLDMDVIIQGDSSGDSAEEKIAESLSTLPKNSVVIMALTNKLGSMNSADKSYRKLAKERAYKFASTTSLGSLPNKQFKDFVEAINIDYLTLQREMQILKERLDAASEVHITTPAGTDVALSIKHQKAISSAGEYNIGGKGGNIPVGEVYMPPDKKEVNGTIVIDGSMRDHLKTRIVKEPIKMTVKDGTVTNIEGGKEAELLEASLKRAESVAKYAWGIRRIGELGIGMNPGAKIIGSTIIDEKTRGTCHFALGSNYWFGGTIKAIIHYDQVLRNPTIEIDGKAMKLNESDLS